MAKTHTSGRHGRGRGRGQREERKGGPRAIGEILAELMAQRGFARAHSIEALERAWGEAAGELAAGYTRVSSLRRGRLEVTVANSMLVQELTYQKPGLLRALRQRLPDERIKDLHFRVGAVE